MKLFHNIEPKYSFKKNIAKNKENKRKNKNQTKFHKITSVFLFTDTKLCLIFLLRTYLQVMTDKTKYT